MAGGAAISTEVRVVAPEEPHVELDAPLIVRGGCDRGTTRWTEDWLVALFGERSCSVSLDARPAIAANTVRSSLRAHLDRPPSGGLDYLFHTELDASQAAALLGDLDVPPGLQRLTATGVYRFYAGPAHAGTLPHVHTSALNALARGRKRWAVYVGGDAAETAALTRDAYARYGSGSQAAAWFAAECPALRQRAIRLWEFEQAAGDVVFIPAFHLHAVINLEPALGFTFELTP